jgi:drug/metabolite transporter (DMT)-like permease
MMAVFLALASAAFFGGMTVAVRLGLRGETDAGGAALATVIPALAVALVAAAINLNFQHSDIAKGWPFLLAGLLAPGGSQLLFTLAVREIGASRTSVALGAAPLVAVAIALIFLGEPLRTPLVIGALAVVAGGVLLAAERDRPGHLRARGLLYAAGAAALFATRDNVVRALHAHASPETAAAATLVAGTAIAACWTRRLPSRRELTRLAPAGVLFGVSYICLFEAYWRGRVSVVSPLVATESLWGVALSVLLIRQTEGVGRRLAFGALLIVAGSALIGATR